MTFLEKQDGVELETKFFQRQNSISKYVDSGKGEGKIDHG
jgi:hypothetical protein